MTYITRYNPFRDKYELVGKYPDQDSRKLIQVASQLSSKNPDYIYCLSAALGRSNTPKDPNVFQDGGYRGGHYYLYTNIPKLQIGRSAYLRMLDVLIQDFNPSNQETGLLPSFDVLEELDSPNYPDAFRNTAHALRENLNKIYGEGTEEEFEKALSAMLKFVLKLKRQSE